MRQLKIQQQITNRDTASLEKYLQEVSRLPMVTPDEEVLLAQRIHEKDKSALDKLVKANLRFVISVAKQYQNQGLTLSDLINEGNVGLIKAGMRFDETKGFKFISYAVWWIRQSILQAIVEQGRLVRLPLNKVGSQNKMQKAIDAFSQVNGREPTAEELAKILEMSEETIEDLIKHKTKNISIDEPLSSDDDSQSYTDLLRNDYDTDPEIPVLKISLSNDIQFALKSLPKREQQIINHFYGLDSTEILSLDEIGAKFDITRERVRQIKERAIRQLRKTRRVDNLKKYLG